MFYSFNDTFIGLAATSGNLSKRLIQRPHGITQDGWHSFATSTCRLLNARDTAVAKKLAARSEPVVNETRKIALAAKPEPEPIHEPIRTPEPEPEPYVPSFTALKDKTYNALVAPMGCDHRTAKAKGYRNGWQMLLDNHSGGTVQLLCKHLPTILAGNHIGLLLDGLAERYTGLSSWEDYQVAVREFPAWKPSRESLLAYRERIGV